MSARNLDFIVDLPDPARENLLSFLDARSLSSLCCVCSSWNVAVSSDGKAWKAACRKLGLRMKDGRRLETSYWKAYALSFIKRLNQMRTSACFVTTGLEMYSRDIKAIYYHNEKLGIAFCNGIDVWHFPRIVHNRRFSVSIEPCSLKFDDHRIVVGTKTGMLVSFNFTSSSILTRMIPRQLPSSLTSFDFVSESNVAVGSYLNGSIVLWKLCTGDKVEVIEHRDSMIVKVMLAPRTAENASRHIILFLFSMDFKNICVRTVKFDPTEMTMGRLEVHIVSTILLDPPVSPPNVNAIIGSLLFDGNCLYYPTSSPIVRSRRISVWDVYDREVVTELHMEEDVIKLLAIGKKYLAIHTTGQNRGGEKLQITRRRSSTAEAFCQIPDGILPTWVFDNDCFTFGEKSWLDGFDGSNDRGILFACVVNDERLHTASWTPRIGQDF